MAQIDFDNPELTDVCDVHGWRVGRIVGDGAVPPPENYHIITNAGGEYFLWPDETSEEMLVWIRVTPSAGCVFSCCFVPAYVQVWHDRKQIGYHLAQP